MDCNRIQQSFRRTFRHGWQRATAEIGRCEAMALHVANEMDEVEVAVWWDLSRIVRHFERQGLERQDVKVAVMNAALRLMNDEGESS